MNEKNIGQQFKKLAKNHQWQLYAPAAGRRAYGSTFGTFNDAKDAVDESRAG